MTDKALLLVLLQAAEAESYGLLLRTSDFPRARAALYKARADAGPGAFANLQFRASPFPEGDLVICHGPAQAPAHPTPELASLLDL